MINTIIFDFAGVFVDLDKNAPAIEFSKLGLNDWNDELKQLSLNFEKGKVDELQFIEGIQKYIPDASIEQIRFAWNSIFSNSPIPLYRLEFLQVLSSKYQLFLLGNTDEMLLEKFQHKAGMTFYREFYQCFEKVYFSFELKMRKPEVEIFNYAINKHGLSPKRTLFVDYNKENIAVAESLGFQVWNLHLGEDDVVDLFEKKIILQY